MAVLAEATWPGSLPWMFGIWCPSGDGDGTMVWPPYRPCRLTVGFRWSTDNDRTSWSTVSMSISPKNAPATSTN